MTPNAPTRNRLDLQEAYANAAEALEQSAGIATLTLPCDSIATLETFSSLDQLLLAEAADALLSGDGPRAAERASQRRPTFWNRRMPRLQLQWSLVEVAAALQQEAKAISTALKKRKWPLDELIAAYTSHAAPWMRLDTLARHLDSRDARFDFEQESHGPDWEKVVAKCRTEYLSALDWETFFQTGTVPLSVIRAVASEPYGPVTSPSNCASPPIRPSTLARISKTCPGSAAPRILAARTPVSLKSSIFGFLVSVWITTPPSWAIASIRMTPGIIGFPGKWPSKNASAPFTR